MEFLHNTGSVPGTEELAVEGGIVAIEGLTTLARGDGAVVHIIVTAALGTRQLVATLLAVGTLSLVGNEHVIVTAGADDDAVVSPQDTTLLVLTLCAEQDIFYMTIVIAGGLQTAKPPLHAGFNLTEVSWVAKDARQLAGHRMDLRVEDEITLVLTKDSVFSLTGCQE